VDEEEGGEEEEVEYARAHYEQTVGWYRSPTHDGGVDEAEDGPAHPHRHRWQRELHLQPVKGASVGRRPR